MSTFVYGALTAQREQALAPGRSLEARDAGDTGPRPPNVKTYVDAMAALVPAEVLAIHAVMVSISTTSTETAGRPTTTITNVFDLKATYFALVGLSIALYVFAHLWKRAGTMASGKPRWDWRLDSVRAAVPALAFTLWTMLQRPTAFDAAFPGAINSSNLRILVAIVGAVLLGLIADRLAQQADA